MLSHSVHTFSSLDFVVERRVTIIIQLELSFLFLSNASLHINADVVFVGQWFLKTHCEYYKRV